MKGKSMGYSQKIQLKHSRIYNLLSDIYDTTNEHLVEGVTVKLNAAALKQRFRRFDIVGTDFVGVDGLSQYEASEYITTRPAAV